MNRVAVVTGGASGIGLAVAERLARQDCSIVILDIDEANGMRTAAGIQRLGKQAAFMRVDVTHEGAVRAGFENIVFDHDTVNVLVNVAGGSLHRHKIEEFPLDHWRAVIDLNLTSTFLCCRAAAIPLGHAGEPEDVAEAVAFLASDAAKHMTD